MREIDTLPTWAREDDDVEELDYGVDLGPDMSDMGGGGWAIMRGGATVGYAFESNGGLVIRFSEEPPEPYDPRS